MTGRLDGKIALVTGASRGLGRSAALALAKEGAHVIAMARTQGGLTELDDEIKALGGSATLVPADMKQPYDCHEIIARLVDGSEFLDFKPGYDTGTVCGHARIEGHAIGIIGNNNDGILNTLDDGQHRPGHGDLRRQAENPDFV